MQFLGIDVGTSSIKASLVDGETGQMIASAYYPKKEAEIMAKSPGWAEQDPELWWQNAKLAIKDVLTKDGADAEQVGGIGIAYQMHGLVLVDENQNVLRPSIIWCDSRAVPYGDKAFQSIGSEVSLNHLLNSPGNFTAAKLAWVKENEPELFNKVHKLMLPGDFIGMKLTGEIHTTISGLSEGIFWDFKNHEISSHILNAFGFDASVIPNIAPTFGMQGKIMKSIANELGLPENVHVAYRAGDQPNNALSLNVFEPGEVAATAGTSGVIYGVSGDVKYDPLSRVNSFAHVNHRMQGDEDRIGVLLCINGTGILNSWVKHNIAQTIDYPEMNAAADQIAIGSEGLILLPFGNGAERMLQNKEVGAHVNGLNFNIHHQAHFYRAAQEGIVCALNYGLKILNQTGITPSVIRAGHANLFLSPIFRDTFAGMTGIPVELYKTDGSQGAALGAGLGVGYYKSTADTFKNLEKVQMIEPDASNKNAYDTLYGQWESALKKVMK